MGGGGGAGGTILERMVGPFLRVILDVKHRLTGELVSDCLGYGMDVGLNWWGVTWGHLFTPMLC